MAGIGTYLAHVGSIGWLAGCSARSKLVSSQEPQIQLSIFLQAGHGCQHFESCAIKVLIGITKPEKRETDDMIVSRSLLNCNHKGEMVVYSFGNSLQLAASTMILQCYDYIPTIYYNFYDDASK